MGSWDSGETFHEKGLHQDLAINSTFVFVALFRSLMSYCFSWLLVLSAGADFADRRGAEERH